MFEFTEFLDNGSDDEWDPLDFQDTEWKPIPDSRRPEFPYRPGFTVSVRRHVPPPPFGPGYETPWPKMPKRGTMGHFTTTEWCIRSPVRYTAPHPDTTPSTLRLVSEIACADRRSVDGTQVARCTLDDDDKIYVAKIFDPVYAKPFDEFGSLADVTWLADQSYSREAAAYEHLTRGDTDGLNIPKYYGSWTFDLVLLDEPTIRRPVHFILTELIPGVSMYLLLVNGQSERISPQHRLDILAKSMELEANLDYSGVVHRDFYPRNIMLTGLDNNPKLPGVYLVDLNKAAVLGSRISSWERPRGNHPTSPCFSYWGPCPGPFKTWVPEPHCSDKNAFKGWLASVWKGSPEFYDPDHTELTGHEDYKKPFEKRVPNWKRPKGWTSTTYTLGE